MKQGRLNDNSHHDIYSLVFLKKRIISTDKMSHMFQTKITQSVLLFLEFVPDENLNVLFFVWALISPSRVCIFRLRLRKVGIITCSIL